MHAEGARFCATTGRPIDSSTPPPPKAAPPVAAPDGAGEPRQGLAAEKGVVDLLTEAIALYRKHARAFLMTAAVLFVPASFINSCAISVITGSAAGTAVTERALRISRLGEEIERSEDPETRAKLERELKREFDTAGEDLKRLAGGPLRQANAFILSLAGWAVTALLLYGLVLPLTGGALTIAVADRVLGGNASWREHWMLLFRKLAILLSAVVPAALLVMVGFFCLVIPGIILSFFFTFVAPVALIEGIGGTAALRRSYELVKSDWLRTALMLIIFGILNGVAHWLAGLFIPSGSVFFGTFLGDMMMLLVMPVPITGAVLLYFDLRRKRDGFTSDNLRAELDSLRPRA
jgi:hypothetical protein